MRLRGVAACWLALAALAACGTTEPRAGARCDPGDSLYAAVRDELVLARAEPRPEVGTREGVRSRFDRKSGECTPIVLTRQWSLDGAAPTARLDLLTRELTAAGWTVLPDPSPTAGRAAGAFAPARDFTKQVGGRAVTLAVSYRADEPALTGLVRVPVQRVG